MIASVQVSWLAFVLLAAYVPVPAGPTAVDGGRVQRVVMVSVDGLGSGALDRFGTRLPNLRRLVQEGTLVRRVRGVFPSVTYPSHTTLVTGCLPTRHGITGNGRLSPYVPARFHFEASWIAVPTLWDVARQAGAVTAAVGWPVTVGAPIDYNVPEVWGPGSGGGAVAAHTDPRLLHELRQVMGPWREDRGRLEIDRQAAAAVEAMLAFWRPHLVLLHVVAFDEAQHRHGPDSSQAGEALAQIDRLLGELLATLDELELTGETLVVVVGDHGFERVERAFAPNVALARAGLLDMDEGGAVTGWRVLAQVAGGGMWLVAAPGATPGDRAAARAALASHQPQSLASVSKETLGAGAFAAYSAAAGVVFVDDVSGAVSRELTVGGAHGYDPRRPAMATLALFRGSGVRAGAVLEEAGLETIAPTVAMLAGWALPGTDGRPLVALLAGKD